MIDKNVIEEINAFLHAKAPGLSLDVQDNPAFDSTTLRIGVKIENTRLISNSVPTMDIGAKVIDMLAEVQKASITAIGMEEYIRERELAVLDRLQERLSRALPDPAIDSSIDESRRELGG